MVPRSLSSLLLGLGLCVGTVSGQEEPFRARVRGLAEDPLVLLLEDGRRVRLAGLDLPRPTELREAAVPALRAWLEARVVGAELWFDPQGRKGSESLCTVRVPDVERSLNQEAASDGVALVFAARGARGVNAALRAAGREAQAKGRGGFARSPRPPVQELGYLHGAVLGLHHAGPEWDYRQHIEELAALGYRHVSLLFPCYLERATSSEVRRDLDRCVTDQVLLDTIRQARAAGMSVMLLPIVLLLEPGPEDWRGTLRPESEARFWRSYERFLLRCLDLAEAGGAEAFSVGSELGSMEGRTAAWLRILANARSRFGGLLTYSVNWDHLHVPRFLDALDFVGATAYFSLSDEDDPSAAMLEAGWRRVGEQLRRLRIVRPLVFTELGYPSQDGANRDPWNYRIRPDRIDLQEQADCLAAFLAVVGELEFVRGAYLYDFYDPGGVDDPGYSPRGKPALEKWRAWAERQDEGRITRLPDR